MCCDSIFQGFFHTPLRQAPQRDGGYGSLFGRKLPNRLRAIVDLFGLRFYGFRYFRHAEAYYVKDGKHTSEVETIKQALRFVKRLYGMTLAKDFGPLALKAIRGDAVPTLVGLVVKDKVPAENLAEVLQLIASLGNADDQAIAVRGVLDGGKLSPTDQVRVIFT